MGKRRIAFIWAVCVLTASVPSETTAAEDAPFATAACVAEAPDIVMPLRKQDAAAAKSGRIPGLGAVKARIGWDNRKTMTLDDELFTVTRTFDPVTRGIEITVSGPGEESLTIHFSRGQGLQAYIGARRIDLSSVNDIGEAVHGRAVQAFRERIGNYERRLMAGVASRPDGPHADGFLFVGAFIASLSGDPAAMGRARDLVLRRLQGRLRAVRFDFRDCVTDYERYLLDIDTQRTQCLDAANGRSTWYARAADRLGCEAEFMAGALAGEGQFLSCTALGAVIA